MVSVTDDFCSDQSETSEQSLELSSPCFQEQEFQETCEECSSSVENTTAERTIRLVKKRRHRKKRMLTGVSRQRRAANDRERRRNLTLNQAFVKLKNALPLAQVDTSKIEILRLAVKWIDHLGTLLKDYEEQKDLLDKIQMKTSKSNEYTNITGEATRVRHDCLYHQFPDLKNTLWEECIGLPEIPSDDNEGCIHIRSNSRFYGLFS